MNQKVIGLIKDELGGNIVTEFVTLRSKRYSYFTDDVKNVKKAKNNLIIINTACLRIKSYEIKTKI